MTLLIILVSVFAVVALMVVLGERFGTQTNDEQQAKFSKITWILVFIILLSALVNEMS